MDEYADDPSIHDTAILWRRIPPRWFVLDERKGGIRASSAAFDDSQDGTPMSVLLCDVMEANGRAPRDALVGLEGYALAGISAGSARSCDLKFTHIFAGRRMVRIAAGCVTIGFFGRRSRATCEFLCTAGVFAAESPTLHTGTADPAGSVCANEARKGSLGSLFVPRSASSTRCG